MFSRDRILTSANGEEEAILCWSGKIFDCVHAAQRTEPSHAACSPGSPATMPIGPSCSLQQQLVMPVLCVVLKVGRDGLPAFSEHLWLVYVPALEPGMRKAVFCFVLGSTSALCGALFRLVRRKVLCLFGRKGHPKMSQWVGADGEEQLRLVTCPWQGVGDQHSSCTYFSPFICLAKYLSIF